tara:strand:+ start:26 stop:451 length:426 start_codon:yes stop_codon:yes gene_type:complete
MGMNSTDTAYNFGMFGSTYLDGNGSKIDLDGASAKYYVCAISFLEDSAFSTDPTGLNILDGGVDLGMGNTHFISSEDTQTLDTDWGAVTDAGDDDGKVIGSQTFPKGLTIYGMWDYVELESGACICYVAPRPDYRNRAAAI